MLAHTRYLRDPRVRREAEALAEMGVEVHVIGLSEDGPKGPEPRHAMVNGVQVHRLPIARKRGSKLRYVFEYLATAVLGAVKLSQLNWRRRLDVVHVHNMPDFLVFAAIVPRLTGSQVILDVHDPMPELYMSWKHGALGRLLVSALRLQEWLGCTFAHHVVSVNETMRENLRSKGIPDEKIFIIHNFPDQRLFPIGDPISSWPKSRDRLVLLYCGTVTEHYDLGLAVKAIASLKNEIPITLRILGEGNRLDGVLDLASTLGVWNSIEHIGSVPIDKVRLEMQRADVGISCHSGGVFGDLYFSTKIVEYLTQALPVLSPWTYTIAKYLPDDCVFYFQPGSDADFADNLRRMWGNPAEVLKRLTRAREVLPRLSWQAEKAVLRSFYTAVLNRRSPARVVTQEGTLRLP